MAALFSVDSEIATRLSPLLTVRENAAPTRAKLSQNVGQFVAQRAIDFLRMLKKPRI
jgi:hypothetical protein